MIVRLHCSCGVSYEDEVHGSVEHAFRKAWTSFHRGIGHEPTDAEGALRGRRSYLDVVRFLEGAPPRVTPTDAA